MHRWFTVFCAAVLPLPAASLTAHEREFALQELHKSGMTFGKALEGLSEAQWKFKPAPDRWSIAECAEHVVTTDQMLFVFATQKLMAMPAPESPEKRSDEAVLRASSDRSHRVKTMEFLEPKGRYPTCEATVEALRSGRMKIMEYIKTTQDDLRAHGIKSFGAYSDAYQFLLTISAHADRHAQQIAEVKASPGYPKE